MGFWYLATPYRSFPGTKAQAYVAACKQAAILADAGIAVFCPVAHSHPLALFTARIDADSAEWIKLDMPLLNAAVGMIVCSLPGWDSSEGIRQEQAAANKAGKPIFLMEPGKAPVLPSLSSDTPKPARKTKSNPGNQISRRDLPATGSGVNHLFSRMTNGQPDPDVGMGATVLWHTDRRAGTITEVSFPRGGRYDVLIVVQEDSSIRTDNNGMSESQEYEHRANPDGRKHTFKRVRESGVWVEFEDAFTISGSRYLKKASTKLGLIVGVRKTFHDFSS